MSTAPQNPENTLPATLAQEFEAIDFGHGELVETVVAELGAFSLTAARLAEDQEATETSLTNRKLLERVISLFPQASGEHKLHSDDYIDHATVEIDKSPHMQYVARQVQKHIVWAIAAYKIGFFTGIRSPFYVVGEQDVPEAQAVDLLLMPAAGIQTDYRRWVSENPRIIRYSKTEYERLEAFTNNLGEFDERTIDQLVNDGTALVTIDSYVNGSVVEADSRKSRKKLQAIGALPLERSEKDSREVPHGLSSQQLKDFDVDRHLGILAKHLLVGDAYAELLASDSPIEAAVTREQRLEKLVERLRADMVRLLTVNGLVTEDDARKIVDEKYTL